MFFSSPDVLTEMLHELRDEFEKSGQKKFAMRLLRTYDDLSFQIVERYLPKFRAKLKSLTDGRAWALTQRVSFSFKIDIGNGTEWGEQYKVYLVWTGTLPAL